MGLFSLFKGKKDGADAAPDEAQAPAEPARSAAEEKEAALARQREIARATAAKIDAIEEELVSSMFEGEPAWGKERRARPRPAVEQVELATTELMQDDMLPETVEAESAPIVEEVAIVYANGETGLAEQMLRGHLGADKTIWWMLFDLYQAVNRQDDYDSLAIDYASRFETSPPAWKPPSAAAPATGVAPTESFSGRLDEGAEAQLQRLLQLPASTPAVRLEFHRLQDVTPEGCAALVKGLQALRKQQRELTVAGAAELADLVRSTVVVGQREPGADNWLLLLELLQLLNREKEFEETAMDYCVTFEVSPPSFEQPTHVATTAPARTAAPTDRFLLPALVTGPSVPLCEEIAAFVGQYDPALLDATRLARIDYPAAGALLERLRPLAGERSIELRDANHLVAALFRLLGCAGVLKVFPHKY
jgi:ABC-type transporter Mla MlaB component